MRGREEEELVGVDSGFASGTRSLLYGPPKRTGRDSKVRDSARKRESKGRTVTAQFLRAHRLTRLSQLHTLSRHLEQVRERAKWREHTTLLTSLILFPYGLCQFHECGRPRRKRRETMRITCMCRAIMLFCLVR